MSVTVYLFINETGQVLGYLSIVKVNPLKDVLEKDDKMEKF